jgi:putative transposase
MTKIRKEIIDELMAGSPKGEDLLGPDGLLKRLSGALVERALEAELTEHLGYEKHDPSGNGSGNSRNGTSSKTLRTDIGDVPIQVPRDRKGSFEPQLVKKHQTHMVGFDDKIISMYARGMSVRDIQAHLRELYSTEVSPDLISRVTDAVWEEVRAWQSRPLDPVWPIVFLDALVVKVREQGTVQNQSVFLAIGIGVDGDKEVLGMWIEGTEGARFWLKVITELQNRGVQDMFIVCCDGLKGFPEAIESVFPRTTVQTCIVHLVRNSLRYVPWQERKRVAAELRHIYSAETEAAALAALDDFEKHWQTRYPTIVRSWRSNWERVIPFLAFPFDIRRAIYTTNAIESLNFQLRKIIKTRGHFPSTDAATKLLYLALRNIETTTWKKGPAKFWRNALNQFAIHYPGRLPA